MQLYIYDHCPFCVKARMIFGLHHQPVELKTLLNDDEETPTKLVGKKMVPILVKDDNQAMGESLDIVDYVDNLQDKPRLSEQHNPEVAEWLQRVGSYFNKLIMPIIPVSDFEEFATPQAREYYINKKQALIGDFAESRQQRPALVQQFNHELKALEPLLRHDYAVNDQLSLDDIHLFPVLRALTLVKEIQWPAGVAAYRDTMAKQTQIPLLDQLAN